MRIGIPKESYAGETRVAATPDTVKRLMAKGLEVLVEKDAGTAAAYPDADYQAAGAVLTDSKTVWQTDILTKVRQPTQDELTQLTPNAVLIGLLETCDDTEIKSTLAQQQASMLALERMPRISRAQSMDVLSSQSNIAGYRAALEAASRYGRFFPLMMTSAGSAKPARVVILGVGVAGLQAIATARRLGADVYAYDIRPEVREQIISLGAKPIDLDIGESGSGQGGYAKELSDEAKAKQQQALANELAKAHVIITTAMIPCRPAPKLVTEEVVEQMRTGSVIVDLAAATGGNCALTEPDQVVVKHGVTLVGYTNFPAMVPADASAFYARNLLNLLDSLLETQNDQVVLKDLTTDEITAAMLIAATNKE